MVPPQALAAAKGRRRVAFVVLDLTPVPHLDATAVRMLLTLVSDYRGQRLQLALSNPSERVFAMMERSGLLEVVGAPQTLPSVAHNLLEVVGASWCRPPYAKRRTCAHPQQLFLDAARGARAHLLPRRPLVAQ